MKFVTDLTRLKLEGPIAVPVPGFARFFGETKPTPQTSPCVLPFVVSRTHPIVFLTHNAGNGHGLSQ